MDEPASVEEIASAAGRHFEQAEYARAAEAYQRCIAMLPREPAFHFNLGTAREKLGEMDAAISAFLAAWRLNPKDAWLALFAGAALEAAGRREEAVVLFTLGDEAGPLVRWAKDRSELDPEIRRRSATADRAIREHFTQLHERAVSECEQRFVTTSEAQEKPDLARIRAAIWVQTHERAFEYRTPHQRPDIFYVPALPAQAITARERFAWTASIETKTAEIREEYLAALQSGVPFAPYVDAGSRSPIWSKLSGQMDWSSLHLFKGAQQMPAARFFPRTLAALQATDMVLVNGKPMELFFSRLKPGAHLPGHFGVANNRVTVHLPLIVPQDCAIRVGEEVHTWREGELFVFDDSFEHEAWNRSNSDRVVLIFEAHHPELRAEERAAIEYTFGLRDRWLRQRRVPTA